MGLLTRRISSFRQSVPLAARAVRDWSPRQVVTAIAVAAVVAIVIGMSTVLIPNPVFSREIPPVAWNYPVWLLGSIVTGMLVATYVRPTSPRAHDGGAVTAQNPRSAAGEPAPPDSDERRTSRLGVAGTVLTWFAVGCPVCNKIALLALGYSGALTWFAPAQPILAVTAIVVSGTALIWRLRGQVACPTPRRGAAEAVAS